MDLLSQNVVKYISLSQEERELFLSYFIEKNLKKKEYLLREGEINKGTAFVTDGLLRSYSVDKNGFEHVIQFAPTGWWIGDMYSAIKQKPARLFIDALENTEFLFLYNSDMEMLYKKIPALERLFRILAQNAMISYQARLINFLSLPAKERYRNFCEQYPSLTECLPQKQVASYIGVTPEFLSKMLSELKSEK
ncbi:MAG TPA: Crp/Fnr family transcriptional regulator [Arachidicoccus sp.]